MIKDLEKKLSGEYPVLSRSELFELVDSWGRQSNILTVDRIQIKYCEPKECYDLSNLDLKYIKDLSNVFYGSHYNGNLSKWNLSDKNDFDSMFEKSEFNNDSLKELKISDNTTLDKMFYGSKFNQDISNWIIGKNVTMNQMFYYSNFNNISIFNISFDESIKMNQLFSTNSDFSNKYYNKNSKNEINKEEFLTLYKYINNEYNFLDEEKFLTFNNKTKIEVIENNINNLKQNIDKNNKFLTTEVNKLNEIIKVDPNTIEKIIVKFQNSCNIANDSLQNKISINKDELNKVLILQKLDQNSFDFNGFIK